MRGWTVGSLAAVVCLAVAAPGVARGETPPVFYPESLQGPVTEMSADCDDPTQPGSVTFESSGVAVGSYPGTYTLSGTVSYGPVTVITRDVTDYHSSFTIYSGDVVITGTQRFEPDPGVGYYAPGSYVGFCNTPVSDAVSAGTVPCLYDAVIHTSTGAYTDHGRCEMFIRNGDFSTGLISFQTATTPLGPASVTLDPAAAVNPVGTTHTVTATARDAALQPVSGATIRFRVSGTSSASATCTTGADGRCSFTYQGPQLPGADLITAYADSDNDGTQDVGEPAGEATKAWVLPAATPGQVTGGGQIGSTVGAGDVAFGFNARSTDRGLQGNCTVVDTSGSNTKVKCLTVESLVQTATHATFFGRAEVNGVVTDYRIDVDDLAEPGRGRDTFKIVTGAGYSAAGVLTAGNVQVHR